MKNVKEINSLHLCWIPFQRKWVKLYNPETRKMLRSRDVIFVENAFDLEKSDDASHKFFTGTFGEENEVEEPENMNDR